MICLRDSGINNTTIKQTSTKTLYQTISADMRSFTFLVLLVGVLALQATVIQARRHNFKNQQAKLEKFCLDNPYHKQCSVLHVARPLSDTALRKGYVLSQVFCKALEPECGYFRSLEEKERYMRGLKSQCQTNPRNWKCEFYKEELSQIRSKRF